MARVVVEKPFGRDLASARELNRDCAIGISGGLDFSYRSLPRERGDHEYSIFPVRQFIT